MANKILHNVFQIFRRLSYRIKAGNVILFESINDFDGSSLEVYNYLKKCGMDKKYKLIWAVKNKENLKNKNFNSIEYVGHSIKNLYYENRAKYVFFEDLPPFSKKKDDATVIYLSHGCPTLKDSSGLINAGRHCDYCICTSDDVKNLMCKQVNVKEEQLFINGLPRNDALFEKTNELKKLTKEQFEKVIIWTPTFRKTKTLDDGDCSFLGLPLIESESDLEKINLILKSNNILLIIKLHPRAPQNTSGYNKFSNVLIFNDEELKKSEVKFYSLLGETDALISDYSSIAFDYMLLNKPLAYVTSDISAYKRGFAFKNIFDYMPGDKINSINDFYNFIIDIKGGKDNFSNERNKVSRWANKYSDADNAKRVCDMFIK